MVYDRICLMLPTYMRSGTYLPRFLDSAIATANKDPRSVCFAFCVSKRDADTIKFLAQYDFQGRDHAVIYEDLPRPHLAKYFNMLYGHVHADSTRYGPGVIVTMVGDDMEFRTKNWDLRMLDLINAYDGVGVFWANDDHIARERCAVNLFVTQDMVEATGRPFMCEEFEAEMIDVVWTMVGHYTRSSHFEPDIHIFHNHSGRLPQEEWDGAFKRLHEVQCAVHNRGGKARAKQVAQEIALMLNAKGYKGESTC